MVHGKSMPHSISAFVISAIVMMYSITLYSVIDSEKHFSDDNVDGMVLIPGGTTLMGCPSAVKDCFSQELPVHEVAIDSFYMDRREVTKRDYIECIKARACDIPVAHYDRCVYYRHGKLENPIDCVSWSQAKAYCEWRNKRLPTEEEWEYAARGGLMEKNYPFGDRLTHDQAVFSYNPSDETHLRISGSMEVGKKDANGYGLYDMVGNIAEWVLDCWYDYSRDIPSTGRGPDPTLCEEHILRGGSWVNTSRHVRVYTRVRMQNGWENDSTGFRCAK